MTIALFALGLLVVFCLGHRKGKGQALPHHYDPKRATCPSCHTSFTFKHIGVKTRTKDDKAIIHCVCKKPFEVTFDHKGKPQCRSF